MLFVSFTAIFWTVQAYAEKRTVTAGIARRDFFFYSCLCLLPFAALMLPLSPFLWKPSLWLIPIFAASVLLRYGKLTAIVPTTEKLVPYESQAYMCLGVFLAYVIDGIAGIRAFSVWGVLSVLLAVGGVFLMADVKLRLRKLRVQLLVRILCDVGGGFLTRYALLYCSNALYILLLNAVIVLLWLPRCSLRSYKENSPALKLVFVQQLLGFACLFLGNMAAQKSVTLYAFIRPITLAFCILLAFLTKKEARTPKIKDFLAAAYIGAGMYLQTI